MSAGQSVSRGETQSQNNSGGVPTDSTRVVSVCPNHSGKEKTDFAVWQNPLKKWWQGWESDPRHRDFQSPALPTELPRREGCRTTVRMFNTAIILPKTAPLCQRLFWKTKESAKRERKTVIFAVFSDSAVHLECKARESRRRKRPLQRVRPSRVRQESGRRLCLRWP